MILISAELDLADPGAMGDAVAAAGPAQLAARSTAGCHAYVYAPDPCVPGRVQGYELWEDEQARVAYLQGPAAPDLSVDLGGAALSGAARASWQVVASEPVYDDTPRARADFFSASEQAPDQQIVILGEIDLDDPSQIDGAIERATPLQQATRDDEPGCEAYVFAADPVVDGRIVVYELWEDQATLAAHFEHENYFAMGGLLRSLGITARTAKYRCVPA